MVEFDELEGSEQENSAPFKRFVAFNGDQWLVRFIQGDEKIWEEVYNKHKFALYSYAGSLTNEDKHAGEDLVALAFSKLWHHRHKIQDELHIRRWLFRVVKNAFLDDLDKGKRNAIFLKSLSIEALVDQGTTDEVEMAYADILASLMDEIEELPKRIKAVFELHFFKKKSNKEIAYILEIKEEAAARYVLRAKQLLKSKLFKGDE